MTMKNNKRYPLLSVKQAGLFLLKAKEIYKVPQSVLNSLTCDISTIVEQTVSHLEERVRSELNSMGIGMSEKIYEIFHSPYLRDIFHGLNSEFRLHHFIRENLELVVSEIILIRPIQCSVVYLVKFICAA